MPRSVWNGTITFGMVNVPIKLYSATESKSVHFHQVHARDGSRIEHRRVCSKEDKEVPYEEVVKGYEISNGKYVVLEKDEVKAAAGEKTKTIPIEDFVEVAAMDPEVFDKTYYLGSRDGGEDGYKALLAALERTGRAGIGRMTFHDREYLVAIRALDGVLALHTMRFADELVAADEIELEPPERAPGDREVKMAGRLVESLHEDFRPDRYADEYRAAVLELIERKASGKQIEAPEEEPEESNDDLMAALEASIASDSPSLRRDKAKASGAKRGSKKAKKS